MECIITVWNFLPDDAVTTPDKSHFMSTDLSVFCKLHPFLWQHVSAYGVPLLAIVYIINLQVPGIRQTIRSLGKHNIF